jgi:hypothetical protein
MIRDTNLNSGFYDNLDTNFECAFEMLQKAFSHDDLIDMLNSGNIPQKQIAALKLEKLTNQHDAEVLINNLTGCDGKIREAVALKINQMLPEYARYFALYPDIMAAASIDINSNICRLVIDSVEIIKSFDDNFSNIYLKKILSFLYSAFEELDRFIFRDKKYVINKQLFKLYWCLESLKLFVNKIDNNTLFKVLNRAVNEKEYTIREKVAQILILIKDDEFIELKEKLKCDENYYVRTVFF